MKQNRYIIINLLSLSVTSIFHVILVQKQLIKHDILSNCLNFIVRLNVPIQAIPVGVERSYGTPTGTFRQITSIQNGVK